MRKSSLIFLSILFLALQGCAALSKNPQLERAANFEKGVSNIPQGYFIFLELGGSTTYSDGCQVAPGPVRPSYVLTSSGDFWTDLYALPKALSAPAVGFFGYGDWSDRLFVIDALPFELRPYIDDYVAASVYSVEADGTAIIEINGETYLLKPGQSWADSGVSGPLFGCRISYTERLTNYGLLPQAKIHFDDPVLH
jgi:hypothetical protein